MDSGRKALAQLASTIIASTVHPISVKQFQGHRSPVFSEESTNCDGKQHCSQMLQLSGRSHDLGLHNSALNLLSRTTSYKTCTLHNPECKLVCTKCPVKGHNTKAHYGMASKNQQATNKISPGEEKEISAVYSCFTEIRE